MDKKHFFLKKWPFIKKDKDIFFEAMMKYQCFWVKPRYKFSAGFKGPFYGDLRKIISDPIILEMTGKKIVKILKALTADVVAACSMSGDAWAVAASLLGKIPVILLRKEPHCHGPKSIICGFPFKQNVNIVLLEDSIATGSQLIGFYKNLKKEGYKNIKNIITIINLFHSGPASKYKEKFFLDNHLTLNYIFAIGEYLDYLVENHCISKEYHQVLTNWFTNPVGWSKSRQSWRLLKKLEKNGQIFFKSLVKTKKSAKF